MIFIYQCSNCGERKESSVKKYAIPYFENGKPEIQKRVEVEITQNFFVTPLGKQTLSTPLSGRHNCKDGNKGFFYIVGTRDE